MRVCIPKGHPITCKLYTSSNLALPAKQKAVLLQVTVLGLGMGDIKAGQPLCPALHGLGLRV